MTRDDRLRIAVFIDFDNIEIGVKNTLRQSFDIGKVLEAIKAQVDRLCYVIPEAANDRRGELAKMLVELAPGDLNKVFFT